jgi:predicted MFS family arabinose efflux permease
MAVPAFRTYFTAQAISAFGGAMSALAVTFALIDLGAGAGQLGLVLASGTIPALVLMLVGGVAGDRWERRLIMLGSDVLLAVTMGTIGILVLTGRAEIWHFVVVQLVGGAAMAFTGPTSVGLMPSLVPSEHLQSANSLRISSRNVASIAGPPVAGLLIATSSAGWALAADGLSYLVSALLVARLPRSPGRVQAGMSVWDDIRHGWTAFTSRRWVVLMVLGFATYQASVLPAIFVLGPILAERELDGASSWALVLSARAVGALAVGLVLLRWRPRRPVVASVWLIFLDLPFLLALAGGLPVAAVVVTAAVSSAGVMAADTLWESALQENIPEDVLSRVSSYDWFGSMMINPLGFALIGAAAGGLGVGPVLVAAVGVTVVVHALLLVTPSVWSVTRAPRAPLATAPPAPDAPPAPGRS